jgi:phage tail sheath protein FI
VPEYLAPGVYVEEVSFRSKSIEGVGTSTTAFAGPTLKGSTKLPPELLTSFADFERIYGGVGDLAFDSDNDAAHNRNYIAHAAKAYFDNGGARLYVARALADTAKAARATKSVLNDGATPAKDTVWFGARFPGTHFNAAQVIVQQAVHPTGAKGLANALDGSLARVSDESGKPLGFWFKADGAWTKGSAFDTDVTSAWNPDLPTKVDDLLADADKKPLKVVLITVGVALITSDDGLSRWDGLALGSAHPLAIASTLAAQPSRRSDALALPLALNFTAGTSPNPDALLKGLGGGLQVKATNDEMVEPGARTFTLGGGSDGPAPQAKDYAKALAWLEGIDDVSIVAAPGYSAFFDEKSPGVYQSIQDALLTHVADPRRYRIGVLDSPPDVTPTQMRDLRGLVDSTRAALYYPWIVVANPLAGPNSTEPAEIKLPPSGHVAGIYARNDIQRGVFKAPANEVVRGALRFEPPVNFGQQELLNPIGVNCLRAMPGRGLRVWGARTISSDPEWKYVNVRRYFNYLGASIDRGTQWAVFEPNGEQLWANIRGTVADFLYNEWRNGALLGTKPDEAYFVRCDRTTMTQNDLDNGRLIALIGVAVIKPAEFVIFRIGQKTVDAKN